MPSTVPTLSHSRPLHSWLLLAAAVLGPLLAIAAIWQPVLDHYARAVPRLDAAGVERLLDQADSARLDELSRQRLITHKAPQDDAEVLAIADGILAGRLALPNHPIADIPLPFAADDLEPSSGRLRLRIASLIVPEMLLEAYERGGDERYLRAAMDTVGAWLKFDATARLPRGAVWDRNAVANRVLVYVRLWRHTVRRESVDLRFAADLIAGIQRDAALLANDAHYGYRNNQGLMQNAALLHVAAALPGLPGARDLARHAVARMEAHFSYHVTAEGVVQEHSAGYHAKVVGLLAMALRCMTLLDLAVPPEVGRRYAAALRVHDTLQRPDGTLPLFGDTENRPYPAMIATAIDAGGRAAVPALRPYGAAVAGVHLWPVSGYAAWWQPLAQGGGLAQTTFSWANFVGGAHKHADELSVLYWTPRGDWWTSVGYLEPGGGPQRRAARSWLGSNAPHPVGADFDTPRRSELLASGDGGALRAIDLERRHEDGYRVRRQVIGHEGRHVVLDFAVDPLGRTSRQIWRAPLDVSIESRDGSNWLLTRADSALAVAVTGGSPQQRVTIAHGEEGDSYLIDGARRLVPTDALALGTPAGAWSVIAWGTPSVSTAPPPAEASMVRWDGPEDWRLRLRLDGRAFELQRDGDRLQTIVDGAARSTLNLAAAPDLGAARAELAAAYREAADRHPRFRDHLAYRRTATLGVFVVGVLLVTAAAWMVWRRVRLAGGALLPAAVLVSWAAVSLWLCCAYFA